MAAGCARARPPAAGGDADCPARRESALLSLARPADDPHHLRRALRCGDEPRFRLPQVPRDPRRRRPELHANLQRRVCRTPRRLQDRSQHAGAACRALHRAVGSQYDGRLRQRRQQVRSLTVGRRLLPPIEGLRRLRQRQGHRRRTVALLPDVRGDAVATQPDECCEQRERRGKDRAHRRLYAREEWRCSRRRRKR